MLGLFGEDDAIDQIPGTFTCRGLSEWLSAMRSTWAMTMPPEFRAAMAIASTSSVSASRSMVMLPFTGGGGLAVVVEYSTALFDAATIGRMAGHLGVLLAAVAADPARPLSGLGVLTAAQRH